MDADKMKGWFVLIIVSVTYWPTATQVQLVRQLTAFKAAGFEPGPFGEETMDHDEPFQESASVDRLVPAPDWPTALQAVWLKQATPLSESWVLDGALGLGVTVSCCPFHVSMNVADGGPDPGFCDRPTSSQKDVPAHDTEENQFPSVPGPVAGLTSDHPPLLPRHHAEGLADARNRVELGLLAVETHSWMRGVPTRAVPEFVQGPRAESCDGDRPDRHTKTAAHARNAEKLGRLRADR
jgi:hypothetical protein